MDTPVTPTTAFAVRLQPSRCAYPDAHPAISGVDGDGDGPWVGVLGSGALYGVTVTAGGQAIPQLLVHFSGTGGATATATISGLSAPHVDRGAAPDHQCSSGPPGGGGNGAAASAAVTGR